MHSIHYTGKLHIYRYMYVYAQSPKEAWDKLVCLYVVNTNGRKIQLKTELNVIEKEKFLLMIMP